jgi:hypothetical protein
MAETKQPQGDGVISLSNLKVTTRHLDPQYEIEVHDLIRGNTGLLKVFSLTPKDTKQPRFAARIDDGNAGRLRSPELDIDIDGVSSKIKSDFKGKRNGYAGHHTDRSSNRQDRVFEVEILAPSGQVFSGHVFFNVHFSMTVEMGSYSTVKVETEVIRADQNKPKPK